MLCSVSQLRGSHSCCPPNKFIKISHIAAFIHGHYLALFAHSITSKYGGKDDSTHTNGHGINWKTVSHTSYARPLVCLECCQSARKWVCFCNHCVSTEEPRVSLLVHQHMHRGPVDHPACNTHRQDHRKTTRRATQQHDHRNHMKNIERWGEIDTPGLRSLSVWNCDSHTPLRPSSYSCTHVYSRHVKTYVPMFYVVFLWISLTMDPACANIQNWDIAMVIKPI